jgi:hypothetical protein
MMHRRLIVATVLVALVGLANPVLAEGTHLRAASPTQGFALADLLGTLRAWFGAVWPQNGCGIDPSGGNCIVPPPPGGQTSSISRAPNGCTIDPDGRVVCSSRIQPARRGIRMPNGCGIDPNGAMVCR